MFCTLLALFLVQSPVIGESHFDLFALSTLDCAFLALTDHAAIDFHFLSLKLTIEVSFQEGKKNIRVSLEMEWDFAAIIKI